MLLPSFVYMLNKLTFQVYHPCHLWKLIFHVFFLYKTKAGVHQLEMHSPCMLDIRDKTYFSTLPLEYIKKKYELD